MYSSKAITFLFVLITCAGVLALTGCTPEVDQKWKDMGFPLGENVEVRVSEDQDANHFAVDHRGTSAHVEICQQYKAKLQELGYNQDTEAESKNDSVQVIRTMVKDGETIRLECRDVADRAIVRMETK
jgi:Fe2+ transport system protein FeoA